MQNRPYSFSKLSTYKQCPKKFYYSYIEKVPVENVDRSALFKGGALHSILEYYPEKSTHKLASKFQHIADQFIDSSLGKKYIFKESLREFRFGLDENLNPTSYSDKSAIFRGSIDYICVIDNVATLCDWKSGRYVEEKYQSFDQLLFYAIYFFQRYQQINIINISYVYIEHQIENTLRLERKYLDNYIEQLMSIIHTLENDKDFSRTTSKLCDFCDFKNHCDSQHT